MAKPKRPKHTASDVDVTALDDMAFDLPNLDLGAMGGLPDDDVDDLMSDEERAEEAAASDIAKATKDELHALKSDFQKRAAREQDRFMEAADSEFWVALCFQTRAQKEEFLRKLKLLDLGDKYLDGLMVAKRMGVKIEEKGPAFRPTKGPNKRLTALT